MDKGTVPKGAKYGMKCILLPFRPIKDHREAIQAIMITVQPI